jgi:uncharacterized protein Yka (UPF0111/DUF47 family)
MFMQTLVRWLIPREDHFYGFIEQQASAARKAAETYVRWRDGAIDAEAAMREVQALEDEGDRHVHDMLHALARTFVTPIDREDLERLSKKLDDILDSTNHAVRACALYGVAKPTGSMSKQIDILARATKVIDETAPLLRRHNYIEAVRAVGTISGIEKEADVVFREAMHHLFRDDGVDAKEIIREKAVLEMLQKAIARCAHTAEALVNIAVKHG